MNFQHATGVGGFVTLGEKTYQCTPLCLEDFALASAYLKAKTPDPMEGIADICKELPVEVAKVLVTEAYNARREWGSLDTAEGRRFCMSADGLSFFLFRQTRKHHPDVTLEQLQLECRELEAHIIESVLGRIAELSGLDSKPSPPERVKRKPPAKTKRRTGAK